MRSCSECDLTGCCYSDPEVWGFESIAQAQEITQRIRECHAETLAEVKQETLKRDMPLPRSRKWLYGALRTFFAGVRVRSNCGALGRD